MDEGDSEPARLFLYFIDRSDQYFPKAGILKMLQFAQAYLRDG